MNVKEERNHEKRRNRIYYVVLCVNQAYKVKKEGEIKKEMLGRIIESVGQREKVELKWYKYICILSG